MPRQFKSPLLGLLAVTFFIAAVPGASHAQSAAKSALPDTPEAFGVVMREWVAQNKLRRATVTVRRQGKIVYELGIGGDDPKKPRLLASLSKAITAACIATLIKEGKLDFDTPLKSALKRYFSARREPADKRILDVTIAQLITHRAGLAGNEGDGEASTGKMLVAAILRDGAGAASTKNLLHDALSLGLKRPPGAYQYSNDGYLVLGAIIEEITQQPYEASCRERVLKPAGVSGSLLPEWGIMGPFGGWSMTGADYLVVLDAMQRDGGIVGEKAMRWQQNGGGYRFPGGQVTYGLGLTIRPYEASVNAWHWGGWEFWYRRQANAPKVEANFNTFAFRYGAQNIEVFASVEPRMKPDTRGKLDPELWRALRAVKRW